MDEKIVLYDDTEFIWKFGKMVSKFPDEMLSQSLIFQSRNSINSTKTHENLSEIEILKKNHENLSEIEILKKNHEKEMKFLKNKHFKEIEEIKKKNEEDLHYWKDKYLFVKQYLEILLNPHPISDLHHHH